MFCSIRYPIPIHRYTDHAIHRCDTRNTKLFPVFVGLQGTSTVTIFNRSTESIHESLLEVSDPTVLKNLGTLCTGIYIYIERGNDLLGALRDSVFHASEVVSTRERSLQLASTDQKAPCCLLIPYTDYYDNESRSQL